MTPKTNVEMRPAIASRADPSVDFICPASLLACAAGRCSPAGLATECGKIAKKLEVKDTFHSRSVAYPHFECPQLAQVRQPSIIRMSYCPQDGQAGPAGRPRFTTSACGSDFKPIPSPSEHGRDHPGQRHRPGEMLHVLGVDEDLEGPTVAMQDDIVDRDVERVVAVGPLELVGMPLQRLRAVQRLGHVDDVAVATREKGLRPRRLRRLPRDI